MSKGASYREVTSVTSGLYETCARHTARHTCRILQSAYFCDDCTVRLVQEAFNGRAPIYHGDPFQAFCGLCNHSREVTMRQWFVCGPCWNFILGYQKSVAATAGIQRWWETDVKPKVPHLTLHETEPVKLMPYARGKGTKLQKAAALEILDFIVTDDRKNPPTKLFHIEQKAGPGSIDEMSEFQLDVNDFNDIAGAMNMTKTPCYVVHVQVKHEYAPPTRMTTVSNMWWTDIFAIEQNKKRVAGRRGEDKQAIYFKPAAFKPIETFAEEVLKAGYTAQSAALAKSPIALITALKPVAKK